jgi:hypothetical protein
MFDYLTLSVVIDNSIFCIHGGLSPSIFCLDQIKVLDRFKGSIQLNWLWFLLECFRNTSWRTCCGSHVERSWWRERRLCHVSPVRSWCFRINIHKILMRKLMFLFHWRLFQEVRVIPLGSTSFNISMKRTAWNTFYEPINSVWKDIKYKFFYFASSHNQGSVRRFALNGMVSTQLLLSLRKLG